MSNYCDLFFFSLSFFSFFFLESPLLIVFIGASRPKLAHPAVLDTTDIGENEDHVVQNLQLQSIP